MKTTNITIFILLIIFVPCLAQKKILKGYIIDSYGIKKMVEIEDQEWIRTPKKFSIRFENSDSTFKVYPEDLQEINIENSIKYISRKIWYPQKESDLNSIYGGNRIPFVSNQIFLKVLIEGKYNLYEYNKDHNLLFFANRQNDTITCLNKYKYIDHKTNNIREYNQYIGQLLEIFKNENPDFQDFNLIKYDLRDLSSLFKKFNKSYLDSTKIYETHRSKINTMFKFQAGLGVGRIGIEDKVYNFFNFPKETKVTFLPGFEIEIQIINKYSHYAFFLQPIYRGFKSEVLINNQYPHKFTYKVIELPIGIKRYIKLRNDSKFYFSLAYNLNLNLKTNLTDGDNRKVTGFYNSSNSIIGAGIATSKNITFQINYHIFRKPTWPYPNNLVSNYTPINFNVGIPIKFKK